MEKIKTTSKQRNILFVESDKELIRSIKEYAENHEMNEKYTLNFIFAGSAKEALKRMSESKIDLIVLEIMLPVINGYYLLEALNKEPNRIPVVVYTKLKGPQDLAKLASLKVENIFIKQLVKMEDLIQMLAGVDSLEAELDKVVLELQKQLKAISENETQIHLKVIQCPRCGMILSRDSHFCNNCGQKIFKTTKGLKVKETPAEAPKETKQAQ